MPEVSVGRALFGVSGVGARWHGDNRAVRGSDEINAEEKLLDGTSRATVRHQATLVALELLLP